MPQEISEQDTSLITARTPLDTFPVGSFFFTHGSRTGQEVPLSRDAFFIGRSKNNNLVLNDKSVSRKHAVVNLLEGEYVLSDLNSLKGTYVNGKKIEEVKLRPGDIINIGENRMQFRLVTPSGTWVAPGKSRSIWYFVIGMLLTLMIVGGGWFVSEYYLSKRLPAEVMAKIEQHYENGVDYFNRDRNIKKARDEWKKILELDPEKRTDYAVKAANLLKNTEPEKQSE